MNLKININLKKVNRWVLSRLNSISLIVSFLLVIGFGFFLYFNFYQTIISAKKIIVLQNDISPAKINVTLLDAVETSYQNKLGYQEYDWSGFSQYFSSNLSNSARPEDSGPTPQTSF